LFFFFFLVLVSAIRSLDISAFVPFTPIPRIHTLFFGNMISSLFLRSVPLFFVFSQLGEAQQSYQLDVEYSGANFFDGWDFFTVCDSSIGREES